MVNSGATEQLRIIDYGDGTYFMPLVADISSSTVEVSVHASDQRAISVQANVTCVGI